MGGGGGWLEWEGVYMVIFLFYFFTLLQQSIMCVECIMAKTPKRGRRVTKKNKKRFIPVKILDRRRFETEQSPVVNSSLGQNRQGFRKTVSVSKHRKTKKSTAGNGMINLLFDENLPCDETVKVAKYTADLKIPIKGEIQEYFFGYCPNAGGCPSRDIEHPETQYKVCGEYVGTLPDGFSPRLRPTDPYTIIGPFSTNIYRCPVCGVSKGGWKKYLVLGKY